MNLDGDNIQGFGGGIKADNITNLSNIDGLRKNKKKIKY